MEWISVKNELPSESGQYLVKFKGSPFNKRGQAVSDFSDLISPNFSYDRMHKDSVTHWMPLPESPEE